MIKILPRNIIRFIALVLVQVLIFNNMELNVYLMPFVYVLFILLLPFETPGWMLLILGFLLGFSVDVLSGTMGMHTVASVFMAYLRPTALTMIAPRDGYEAGSFPRVYYYGLFWFARYALILVFAHHTVLFFTEVFELNDIPHIFLRILLSTIFTVVLLCISQYFVFRK